MTDKKDFCPGDIIFRKGDLTDGFYLVDAGIVAIYDGYGTDAATELTHVEAGGIFGELGVIDYMPRSADAVAASACTLTFIPSAEFNDFLRAHPQYTRQVLISISTRLKSLTADYTQVCADIREYIPAEDKSSLIQKLTRWISDGLKFSKLM